METELWRDVPEYEGLYRVSDQGRVMSLVGPHGERRERILKPGIGSHGYFLVTLCKNGKIRSHNIHRLVLRAFKRPMRKDQTVTRHLNGIRTDNRLCNLAWGSPRENQTDRVLHGTDNRGERYGLAKLTERDVLEIRRRYAGEGISQRKLAREFGLHQTHIGDIVNRKCWAHITP